MKSHVQEKQMYKCTDCGNAYNQYHLATECAWLHAKETALNADFDSGYFTLDTLFHKYGIHKELPDEMKKIDKDSCFTISYLQCCDYPAYIISHISNYGDITVCGDGSWSGYYSSEVGYHDLMDPRPKEELWKYSESGQFGRNKNVKSQSEKG